MSCLITMDKKKLAAFILLILSGTLILPNHNIFATLFLFFGFLSAYMFSTIFFKRIRIEKLVILTLGVFFSFIALFGFLMTFFGLEIRLLYFLSAFILLSIILHYWRKRIKFEAPKVEIDRNRLLTTVVIFLVSFCFYIYPALPNMFSACTPGFDCTHHLEYMQGIYEQKRLISPIVEWTYYPPGLYLNVALLTEGLTTSGPDYANVVYPFMTLITALIITLTCALLMDRKISKVYALILAAMLLFSVYPASALIGYGFWPQMFGIFFVILFFWILSDYLKEPKQNIVFLLGLLCVASFLSYHVISAMITVVGFIIATLLVSKINLRKRLTHLVFFLLIFLLIFSANTLGNYLHYLNSDVEIYTDAPSNYQSIILTYVERHSINLKSFQALVLIHKRQLEQHGAIILFKFGRFGLAIIFLSMLAIIYTRRYDASFIFFVSVLLEMLFFHWKLTSWEVSGYYYSKIAYILVYPLLLFSVIGIETIIRSSTRLRRPFHWKKIISVALTILLLLVLIYSTGLHKESGIFIGDNQDLFHATDATWVPYITFNRMDYFYASGQQREPYKYTFFDWISGRIKGEHTTKEDSSSYQQSKHQIELIDTLDVGNITDEKAHDYTIGNQTRSGRENITYLNKKTISDDFRAYNDYESFIANSIPHQDLILVKRVDVSIANQSTRVYLHGIYIGNLQSKEFDRINSARNISNRVPGEYIKGKKVSLMFVYESGNPDVKSFYYWIYS